MLAKEFITEGFDFGITIKPSPTLDGYMLISTKETSGTPVKAIELIAYAAIKVKKYAPKTKMGKDVDVLKFKSNGIQIRGTEQDAERLAQIGINKAKQHQKWQDNRRDPARQKAAAKERSAYAAEKRKKTQAELVARYGADIVKRVKVKNARHLGDDGYQWYLEVDGRDIKHGMTQYQARGEQRMMWDHLKKLSEMTPEELQQYRDQAEGWRLYFIDQEIGKQLPGYLKKIDQSAKKSLSDFKAYKTFRNKVLGKP